MVTIREDGRERRVTAAEAFLLQLTRRGLQGDSAAARASLAAIEHARLKQQLDVPTIGAIVCKGVSPGTPRKVCPGIRYRAILSRRRKPTVKEKPARKATMAKPAKKGTMERPAMNCSGLAPGSWMQTTVIYDGDCPFCENYTQLMKLRQIGDLELIDARQRPDVVRDLNARGIRLDSGMVVLVGGHFFHGADAMRKLSMHPGMGSAFSRLNRMVFLPLAPSRFDLLRTFTSAGRLQRGGAINAA